MTGTRPWIILLAGGDGTRLRGISLDARGRPAPKQYCTFGTERSLLSRALDRASQLAEPGRILPVVQESHRAWWRHSLAHFRDDAIAVQPENRGTAAAILLSTLCIAHRDPDATIVVLPSDHHVENEEAFTRSLRRAVFHAGQEPDATILLGIAPDRPECDYGWIVPFGHGDHETSRVARFVEKPDAEHATRLMREGGLWNSFVFASGAQALLGLYRWTQPTLLDLFLRHSRVTGGRTTDLKRFYAEIPSRDFSREVLQAAPERLGVLRAEPCGWTDLGTPARLSIWKARQGFPSRPMPEAHSFAERVKMTAGV